MGLPLPTSSAPLGGVFFGPLTKATATSTATRMPPTTNPIFTSLRIMMGFLSQKIARDSVFTSSPLQSSHWAALRNLARLPGVDQQNRRGNRDRRIRAHQNTQQQYECKAVDARSAEDIHDG